MDTPDSSDKKDRLASFSTRSSRVPNIHRPSLKLVQTRSAALAIFLLMVFGVGLLGGFLGSRIFNDSSRIASTTAAKQQYISNESELIAGIAKNVGQSVVSID